MSETVTPAKCSLCDGDSCPEGDTCQYLETPNPQWRRTWHDCDYDSDFDTDDSESTKSSSATDASQVTTWNGAKSYSTLNDPLVEFFFRMVRSITDSDFRSIPTYKKSRDANKKTVKVVIPQDTSPLRQMLIDAFAVDPLSTLKLMFHIRDCRGGRGEKKLFRLCCKYLMDEGHSDHIKVNMHLIPEMGTWKDLLLTFLGTSLEREAISLIADQLETDRRNLLSSSSSSTEAKPHISLCAKFAPNEDGAFDKHHKVVDKLCAELTTPSGRPMKRFQYRKELIAPLRKHLKIVEQQMCAKEWDQIDYSRVPSIAMSNYSKCFKKHDETRFNEHIAKCRKGDKSVKINTGVLMPYQIVGEYLESGGNSVEPKAALDDFLEAQWVSFIKDRSTAVDILPVVDLSGSMCNGASPPPINVAISLGLLVASLNKSPQYSNKWITFSDEPVLETITGDTLHQKLRSMTTTHVGYSTNFEKIFRTLLSNASMFNVPQESMPKVILVLSDMQFNEACSAKKTNWEVVNDLYREAGYTRPILVFWNLTGKSVDFPVPDAQCTDCILLSGFNDSLLNCIVEGSIPNPRMIVDKVIQSPRYAGVKLP